MQWEESISEFFEQIEISKNNHIKANEIYSYVVKEYPASMKINQIFNKYTLYGIKRYEKFNNVKISKDEKNKYLVDKSENIVSKITYETFLDKIAYWTIDQTLVEDCMKSCVESLEKRLKISITDKNDFIEKSVGDFLNINYEIRIGYHLKDYFNEKIDINSIYCLTKKPSGRFCGGYYEIYFVKSIKNNKIYLIDLEVYD